MIDVLDPEGTILDVNHRFCEELGYEEDDVIGRPIWEIDQLVDEDDVRILLGDFVHGERRKFEGVYRRRDGSTFPVEVHLLRLDIEGQDRFMAISRDISERKQHEVGLEQRNQQLEEFASVVSHDLRNPLNVAQGRLKLAQEEWDSEHLEDVANALARSQDLIDDLLTLAKEGNRVSDIEPVDLGMLAENCWRNVETGESTITVETDSTIRADRSRLTQLLENLYRNAIEHGGDDVIVTVGDLSGGFYVEDDGPGISADKRKDVFDVGFSTTESGTGFGLSIIEQIANAHSWEVGIAESDTGGARIEFRGVDSLSADA
jgi:PAS domain S-box-containing protein